VNIPGVCIPLERARTSVTVALVFLLGIVTGLLLGISGGALMVSILILLYEEIYQCCIPNSNDVSVHSGQSGETESTMEIDEICMFYQLQLQAETRPEPDPPQNNGAPANESIDINVESSNGLTLRMDGLKRPSQRQLQLSGIQEETGPEKDPPQDNGAPANESIDADVESNNELRWKRDVSKWKSTGLKCSSIRQENPIRDSLDDESLPADADAKANQNRSRGNDETCQ
jgi:hypothetical protein